MAVTIDEVTAEVTPEQDHAPRADGAATLPTQPHPCVERRQLRQNLEHLKERTARVRTD